MQQSDIDAKERNALIDTTFKRAEELVKYLQDQLKTINDAVTAIKEGGVIDLGPLKEQAQKAFDLATQAFADVQALKTRFDSLTSEVGSLTSRMSSAEITLTSVNQRLIKLETAPVVVLNSPDIAAAPATATATI
jgi:hypothetical protein